MDNKDVAVIVTVEKDNGSVEIKNLAVDAAFRRRGVGRKMLVYVEMVYLYKYSNKNDTEEHS